MAKKVFYDDDARRRLLGGAAVLYNAVKTTMGPKGRNVVIGKSYGNPTVTHDGVTVAKGVELDDVDDETLGYKVGAELIKQAASKMNDVAGDGTTTVTVLTYHILSEANKLIAAGHNPMLLRKGLEAAAHEVLAHLGDLSEDIAGKKSRVAEVATISAGDPQIGNLIAEVMEKVGKDGVVTVEEGQGLALESEVVEGFTMDRGYVSALMVTDTARMEAVYEKPAILITDQKISSIQEFLPMLEKLAQAGKKDLVLVADDIEGEALGTLILNDTTIIEGAGSVADVKKRIEQINNQIKNAKSEWDKEKLEKRRAALQGKVAVIKVGGATTTEIEEKKFRVDDAVAAVKAALDDGIVAGGGVTFINLASSVHGLVRKTQKEAEGRDNRQLHAGVDILYHALEQPFRILMTNSGLNADEWLPQVRKAKIGWGVDVNNPDKLVDLKTVGVVDPVRVVKEAVQNAASIAGTAMTMGALVVDVPEKNPPMPPPDMGGGMMGM
jgi:chaperonin GroEL